MHADGRGLDDQVAVARGGAGAVEGDAGDGQARRGLAQGEEQPAARGELDVGDEDFRGALHGAGEGEGAAGSVTPEQSPQPDDVPDPDETSRPDARR